jgi:HAD superfamily hydrolase (TIGR01450 family)
MSRCDAATATIEPVDDWIGGIETVLCDLDGVVWLAHQPIVGSAAAVASLRASGRRVLFVTNNSASTLAEHDHALAAVGIPGSGDVVSSAAAAALLVAPGERVLVAAGAGVVEALERRGVHVVVNTGDAFDGAIDAVVVGMHRAFDYDRLALAAAAARSCGRLIGTNSDSTYPTPNGLLPGGGAILAAVAAASGVEPVVAGKPFQPMAALVGSMLGADHASLDSDVSIMDSVVMVGDRPETDGRFAARLGCRFVLVRSGVSRPGEVVEVANDAERIDLDVDDLAAVARRLAIPRLTAQ